MYDDAYLRRILRDTKTIAMVGLSANWNRPSYFAAKYLLDRGYKKLVGFETPEKGYEWFGGAPGHEALSAYGLLEFHDMKAVYGDVDGAIAEFRKAISIDPDDARAQINLGGCLCDAKGDYDGAEPLFREALAAGVEVLPCRFAFAADGVRFAGVVPVLPRQPERGGSPA